MHAHRLTTVAAIKQFVRAGNAKFTLVSKKTGTRFTYRSRASDDGKVWFVAVLTGANNEADYKFLGTIFGGGEYRHGRKSSIGYEAPSAVAFQFFFSAIGRGVIPASLEVWHEGRCGRCGRTLTVPESIRTGFGPECADKLGIVVTKEEVEAAELDLVDMAELERDMDRMVREGEEQQERAAYDAKPDYKFLRMVAQGGVA